MLSEASLAQHEEGHDLRREGRSKRSWSPKERREVAGGRQEIERGVSWWVVTLTVIFTKTVLPPSLTCHSQWCTSACQSSWDEKAVK